MDFPKTGVMPPLEHFEKPKRKPDFMQNLSALNYCSRRINGDLFRLLWTPKMFPREICLIGRIVEGSSPEKILLPLSDQFILEGWKKFEEAAKELNLQYTVAMKV